VPTGGQGPRLQAVVALLTGAYRLSKRQVESLCADILGVPLSAGQVCALEADTVVFTQWYRVRDGTIQRVTLRKYVDSQRPWFRARLEAGLACGCTKTAGVCQDLLRLEPALWTFTRREGVEPTNNAVERGFRHPAQWRRSSHETASKAGSRFVEHILTVVATCRQQGRDVLSYLTACCEARLHGDQPPSLLPEAAD
jgi:transposase